VACSSEWRERIGELAGGRLEGGAVAALLDHVERCEPCSLELDDVAALVARADGAAGAAPRRAPVAAGRIPPSRRLLAVASALAAASLLWLGAALVRSSATLAPRAVGRAERLAALARLDPLVPAEGILRGEGDLETETWRDAMRALAQGRWPEAIAALEASRAAGDERALLDLYLGVARLQVGELERASADLARAAEGGTGMVRERSLWYLAQARLASGDSGGARSALERLLALAGEYAPNARALLAEIDRATGE